LQIKKYRYRSKIFNTLYKEIYHLFITLTLNNITSPIEVVDAVIVVEAVFVVDVVDAIDVVDVIDIGGEIVANILLLH